MERRCRRCSAMLRPSAQSVPEIHLRLSAQFPARMSLPASRRVHATRTRGLSAPAPRTLAPAQVPLKRRPPAGPTSGSASGQASRRRHLAPTSASLHARLVTKAPSGLAKRLDVALDAGVAELRPNDGESSGESSSEEGEAPQMDGAAHRRRHLNQKVGQRLRRYVEEMMTRSSTRLTYLERLAVTKRVREEYRGELDKFMDCTKTKELNLVTDREVDDAVVAYFHSLYLAGNHAYRGEKLIASLLHHFPEFGRVGGRHLPRSWRALKGWRRLTPGFSRRPFPLCFWAAVATEMEARGSLQMAIFTLIALSAYLRPPEAMGLKKRDLVGPITGGTRFWSLLVCPQERKATTKTGERDVSVMMDSAWSQGWLEPLLELLKVGDRVRVELRLLGLLGDVQEGPELGGGGAVGPLPAPALGCQHRQSRAAPEF